MSIAYLFPGQGSQKVGMGLDLFEQVPEARALFEQADSQLGFSLSELCFNGPEADLTDTVNQQPAMFVTSLAMLKTMELAGWEQPAFAAGHSLGELTALTAVNSISFTDGLQLVRTRGELMKAAGEQEPGAMAAILALDIPTVESVCAQARDLTDARLQVANDNCPGQVVISGDEIAIEKAMVLAKEAGARKVVKLPITIAAHSALMASAATEFAEAVANTPITTPDIPIIGNVQAKPLTTSDEIRTELTAQLTSAVAWTPSINYLVDQGVNTFAEVGPGEVLLGLVKRVNRKSKRLKFKLEDRE